MTHGRFTGHGRPRAWVAGDVFPLLVFFFAFAFVPTMLEIAISMLRIALVKAADAVAKVPFFLDAIAFSF